MGNYLFVGTGEGVPGLPHEITQAQAKAWADDYVAQVQELKANGVKDDEIAHQLSLHPHVQLSAALKNGNYREQGGTKESQPEEEPARPGKKR